MESISVGPYQSILLTEIAATHAAMQEDIFALKQLSLKNSSSSVKTLKIFQFTWVT